MRTAAEIYSDLRRWRQRDAEWRESLGFADRASIHVGNEVFDPKRSDKLKILSEAKDFLELTDPTDMVLPWVIDAFKTSLTPGKVTECLDRLEAGLSPHAKQQE